MKPLRKNFLGAASLFLILILVEGCICQTHSLKGKDRVCFKNQCVKVEVVQKSEDLTRGLMFRSQLAPDTGMLFIFPAVGEHIFWMKNTLMPLDIIWLDYARRIVDIAVDVPPCMTEPCAVYRPSGEALYVLEVNAHHSQVLGLKKGDEAQFKLKGLGSKVCKIFTK